MYPGTYDPSRCCHTGRTKRHTREDMFTCKRCGAVVYIEPLLSGVQNRNHCPYCLWSRHVDHIYAGDRMSACKAVMEPIGLTVKRSKNRYAVDAPGELMLIHLCSDCGKLSINRIAADDLVERLMGIFHSSLSLNDVIRDQLEANGIRLLEAEDMQMVTCQLLGCVVI